MLEGVGGCEGPKVIEDGDKHFNDVESYLFIKQKTKQMKPCSRDTEKPCGYRVEVPQHNETS